MLITALFNYMINIKNTQLVFLFCIAISSCTNIYYVGQTTEPLKVYYERDTTSLLTYTIPIGSKVLTKKKLKKYHHIIFKDHKGYVFRPIYTGYHKYKVSVDGELYGYSSVKTKSSSSSYSGSSGTVNVKGYYRKNGTYVSPHTRSAPSRRH
jgi:hypothetical protein